MISCISVKKSRLNNNRLLFLAALSGSNYIHLWGLMGLWKSHLGEIPSEMTNDRPFLDLNSLWADGPMAQFSREGPVNLFFLVMPISEKAEPNECTSEWRKPLISMKLEKLAKYIYMFLVWNQGSWSSKMPEIKDLTVPRARFDIPYLFIYTYIYL